MKCDLSHREGSSGSIEILKSGLGIISYFTIYIIVGCLVTLLLF